jgi:hypothetical protein
VVAKESGRHVTRKTLCLPLGKSGDKSRTLSRGRIAHWVRRLLSGTDSKPEVSRRVRIGHGGAAAKVNFSDCSGMGELSPVIGTLKAIVRTKGG